MVIVLIAHVYFVISMTTMNTKWPWTLFPITTSSLLKLANNAMHGGETWHAGVFLHFHDNNGQNIASGIVGTTLHSGYK